MLFRTETNDAAIWQAVYSDNEYGLPSNMDGWVVLDIGAHIGAFTLACLDRQAARVWACEPDPRNAAQYRLNIADPRAILLQAAVTGNHSLAARELYPCPITEECSGHSLVLHCGKSISVPAISFNSLVTMALGSRRSIEFCKMDCEGSEYEVIDDCLDQFTHISRLAVEFHEPYRRNADHYMNRLRGCFTEKVREKRGLFAFWYGEKA